MTNKNHRIAFAGAMAAVFCLTTLAPTRSNEAVAQSTAAQAYYNGYGAGYYRGYESAYGNNGYTGYGSGPYGYPLSTGYGYRNGSYNSLYNRALRLHGETNRPIYSPNTARFYSPYGY